MGKSPEPVNRSRWRRSALIVDDCAAARQIVRTILQAAGFACIEAADGRQALQHLHPGHDVGLVLTDLEMPELDGFGLITAVGRLEGDQIPILVCSGKLDDPRVLARPELSLASALLFKPITAALLIRSIHSVLEPMDRRKGTAARS